jgi:hypothetical protein
MRLSEDQAIAPFGLDEALTATQGHLQIEGEWDQLSTKTLMVLRNAILGEAEMMAYRDCYMAIAVSSLLAVVFTLFLRVSRRR